MSENVEDDDEAGKNYVRRPVMFLGRDLTQIRCFRKSFIYGINVGFAGGLLYFLCTSNSRMSAHVAFGSGWLTVFVYWTRCRYKYESFILAQNEAKSKAQKNIARKWTEEFENSAST